MSDSTISFERPMNTLGDLVRIKFQQMEADNLPFNKEIPNQYPATKLSEHLRFNGERAAKVYSENAELNNKNEWFDFHETCSHLLNTYPGTYYKLNFRIEMCFLCLLEAEYQSTDGEESTTLDQLDMYHQSYGRNF